MILIFNIIYVILSISTLKYINSKAAQYSNDIGQLFDYKQYRM